MMLSIMVVGAGAVFADQSDIDSKHQEAVDMCAALNIITGFENGKFMPNDNVTREQMAKMICILDNGGKEPQLSTGNTFTDVPADRWSNKYIEACASRGVVVGVGGGKFAPAGKVTATQAAKMLLVELGYDDDLQQYSGSDWATKVNVDATKKGYYEDLEDIDVNAPLTREHAAQMVWNALQAKEVEYTYTLVTNPDGSITSKVTVGDMTKGDGAVSLMYDKYGAYVDEGTMTKFSYSSKDDEWTYVINNVSYVLAADVTDLLGQNVKVVIEDADVIITDGHYVVRSASSYDAYGIFAEDSVVLFSGVVGDLPSLGNSDTDFKFDGAKYKLNPANVSAVPVYYFHADTDYNVYPTVTVGTGASATTAIQAARYLSDLAGKVGDTTTNITKYDAYNFNAIDKDGDGKIDFVMVYPFAVAEVTYSNGTDIKLSAVTDSGNQALITDGVVTIPSGKIALEDVDAYDNLDEDDYVVFVPDKNTANDTATLTKIDLANGKVSVKDGSKLTIDGTVYTKDASFTETVNAGSNLKDIVAYNNYIFAADVSANFDVTDYAVVIGYEHGAYGDTAKLLFSDGSKKVVDLDTDVSTAPATGTAANGTTDVVIGYLYTFDTNKDGEYQLTKATDAGTGFDYALGNGTQANHANSVTGNVVVQKLNNSTPAKAGYINGYKVADDAVIFVQYNQKVSGTNVTYSYKEISGATMKTMKLADFTSAGFYVLATKDSSSGVGEVNLAYVTANTADIKSVDSNYGYILGIVEAQNEDNQDIYQVNMMTKDAPEGTQINTVKLTSTLRNKLAAGMDVGVAVEYTLDEDGNIDGVEQALPAMNAVITGKDADALWLSGTRTELDDDAIFLIVDASEPEAIKVGTVDDVKVAKDNDGLNGLDANAYVIKNDSGDIALVVYDADNGDSASTVAVTVTGGDIFKPEYPTSVSTKSGTTFDLVLPAVASGGFTAAQAGTYRITVTGATVTDADYSPAMAVREVEEGSVYEIFPDTNRAFGEKTFTIGNITGPVTITIEKQTTPTT